MTLLLGIVYLSNSRGESIVLYIMETKCRQVDPLIFGCIPYLIGKYLGCLQQSFTQDSDELLNSNSFLLHRISISQSDCLIF